MSLPHSSRLSIVTLIGTLLLPGAPGFAQQDQPAAPPVVNATPLPVDATVTAVTLYPGRAAVTRTAAINLQPGAYDLRFTNLPESVQPGNLQARTGAGLKVLSVDFVQEAAADVATTPEVADLDKQIKRLSQALRAMVDQRELIKSQEEFLNALTIRTTADASNASGTPQLDLDAVQKQMQFITAERKRLQSERAALDVEQPKLESDLAAAKANRDAAAAKAGATRTAVVSVVTPTPFNGEVALTYLVSNATWQPSYNIRVANELDSVEVEYDAVLQQRTGEDWNDVRLTLSTAQPSVATNPPSLDPWYVDIARPQANLGFTAPAASVEAEAGRFRRAEMEDKSKNADLDGLAADAQVSGGGPSVTFELPRAVTVKSNSERQQRTRIASIDSASMFVHVATPMLSESVYLRGDLINRSPYQLLPGEAAIFVGQDYVGPTQMRSVAPGGEYQTHFGIDQAVKIKRQLVNKITENTGLLSGGRRTIYDYRLVIDNGSGHDITLELWDRIPVSRNEEIQIELTDPSVKLASDQLYLTEMRPMGLLKWWLTIPAGSRGLNSMEITYSVRIDRAKDVQMTPLPE